MVDYADVQGPQPVAYLELIPNLRAETIAQDVTKLAGFWKDRDGAFDGFDDIFSLLDENKEEGLESMVANNAKTLLSLAHFMVATSIPQRTVAVGSQGPQVRRKSGLAERALDSWWQAIDEERLQAGEESWQYTMAYWMCLYGWYATLAMTTVDGDEPYFVAIPYNPRECYPEFAGGRLARFARKYETTADDASRRAKKYGQSLALPNLLQTVTINEWWYRHEGTNGPEILNAVVASGGSLGHQWIKPPDVVEGLEDIPILTGPVGGTPSRSGGWMKNPGSVLAENEVIYKSFNRWLSFLSQLVREHAQAAILVKGATPEVEEEQIRPTDIRASRAIIQTTDPEAKMERVDVGESPIDIFRLLTIISGMEQRGGFPESAYGGLMQTVSGFALSQLLQAAERRVGPQANKLAQIDMLIGKRWLKDFRDNDFPSITIEGFEGGNPRKSFIEDCRPQDIPEKFRMSTNIPIRIGNDMMTRMQIARQAVGGQGEILDLFTTLDEILQQQDPNLVMDRISEDRTRTLLEPVRLALNARLYAADLRASRKPGAEEAAQIAEQFGEYLLEQQRQAMGAQPKERVSPEMMPPEARGLSPDLVRSAMQMGPPPNLRRGEQGL